MFAQGVPFVSEITTNSSKRTDINTVLYVRSDELQILTNIIIRQISFHVRLFMMGKSCVGHTPWTTLAMFDFNPISCLHAVVCTCIKTYQHNVLIQQITFYRMWHGSWKRVSFSNFIFSYRWLLMLEQFGFWSPSSARAYNLDAQHCDHSALLSVNVSVLWSPNRCRCNWRKLSDAVSNGRKPRPKHCRWFL